MHLAVLVKLMTSFFVSLKVVKFIFLSKKDDLVGRVSAWQVLLVRVVAQRRVCLRVLAEFDRGLLKAAHELCLLSLLELLFADLVDGQAVVVPVFWLHVRRVLFVLHAYKCLIGFLFILLQDGDGVVSRATHVGEC